MDVPRKHGCLVAWLYLIIIGGTFGLITLLFLSDAPHRPSYHPPSAQLLWGAAACMLISMVCAGGLFLLKRWAFYGYVLAQMVLFGLNCAVGFDARSLSPLFQIAILIGVMQLGGRYKAWDRLR